MENIQFAGYGRVAKLLHWLIAVLIICNLTTGLTLNKFYLYDFHKETGVAIILLVIIRVFWRLSSNYPGMVMSIAPIERVLAKLGHGLLYILMIAMPLSGIMMSDAYGREVWFLGFRIPQLIGAKPHDTAQLFSLAHKYTAYFLIMILVLHVLAALKHHFIGKNEVLRRMIPFGKN